MNDTIFVAIVDDDASVRESTEYLLRSFGYSTATFESAKLFLKSGRLSDTGSLISDIQMPDMSGYELQLRLIADGHKFPIIFIMAQHDEVLRDRVMAAGAHSILSKPYQIQTLIDCLAAVLKNYCKSIRDQ
jgi:FixJ family two-component response regulator